MNLYRLNPIVRKCTLHVYNQGAIILNVGLLFKIIVTCLIVYTKKTANPIICIM